MRPLILLKSWILKPQLKDGMIKQKRMKLNNHELMLKNYLKIVNNEKQ
jgi:hypothetical protein